MAELTFDLTEQHHFPDIASLAGPAWQQLDPATRRRFEAHDAVVYQGNMNIVYCSAPGWLFAQLCRLFGCPLVHAAGTNIAAEVAVYPTRSQRGMVWERRYHFGHQSLKAVSVKTWHQALGLMECVTGGLGMILKVTANNGALHFTSQRYFLKFGTFHLPLPACLTPGTTQVCHRDLGNGQFTFTLAIEHPWYGTTFFQHGIFTDPRVPG